MTLEGSGVCYISQHQDCPTKPAWLLLGNLHSKVPSHRCKDVEAFPRSLKS